MAVQTELTERNPVTVYKALSVKFPQAARRLAGCEGHRHHLSVVVRVIY